MRLAVGAAKRSLEGAAGYRWLLASRAREVGIVRGVATPEKPPMTECRSCGAKLLLPRPKHRLDTYVLRCHCGRAWYADVAAVTDTDGGVKRFVHWQLTRELGPVD
jgi:hypothetical protein